MSEPAPKIRRALISVSDKTGLGALGTALAGHGITILSTGGSAAALRQAGLAVTDVATVTGQPEILGGRVKTLHPRIHGGLLGRPDQARDRQESQRYGIEPIELLICNLYPFARTVAAGADPDTCIETIDIGGPALIRAAAKNHPVVTVVTDPDAYDALLAELDAQGGGTSLPMRRRLAAAAFAHTAAYDAAIAAWFADQPDIGPAPADGPPPRLTLSGDRAAPLRYGENPHQPAGFYRLATDRRPGPATAVQLQGKSLSYNNLNDTDAAFELVAEFSRPAVAIIKHANPCGVAEAGSLAAAWPAALACDPVSAFGGIIAVNRPLDADIAAEIARLFVEVVIAPGVTDQARAVLAAKPSLRLLDAGALPDPAAEALAVRSIAGGLLVQSRDTRQVGTADLTCVTRRQPTEREIADMLVAVRVAKHVKSNAIVYARDGATVGIGAGQMSRVDSARIAAAKAQDASRRAGLDTPMTRGAVVASDAFFPFADGLLAAVEAGATAVIQPGGSQRDSEVIAAADDHGLAMVMTGIRHFRH